jgi:hypothetical protein
MNSIINKIFYDYEIYNSEEQILKLQKYSIQKCMEKQTNNIPESFLKEEKKENLNIFETVLDTVLKTDLSLVYYPFRGSNGTPHPNDICVLKPPPIDKEDTIFWCIYIQIYGLDEFLQIGSKYKNRMLEEKIKIIDKIKNSPKDFKNKCNFKISNNLIQEILSDLYAFKNKKTSSILTTVMAYAYYYNIKIEIYNDNTYIQFYNINEEEQTPLILYFYKEEFGIVLDNKEYFEKNKDNYYKVGFLKPLNGISTYKMSELEFIAKKLKIYNPELKKIELYNIINHKCLW